MEFKEVVGLRRSIRFWQPWRPVEDGKIQAILEAIYRAPRVLEVDFVRAVVLRRDRLTPEDIAALKTPTTTAQIDLCPIYLWIYANLEALEQATDGKGLEHLVEVGALNPSHGWTRERIHRTIVPEIYRDALDDADRIPILPRRDPDAPPAPTYSRRHVALGRTAIGIAQAHALLAAVDEGLGAQLSAMNPMVPKRLMGIPDSWITSSPVLLGYAAEDLEAGGQRPREPLGEDFFEGRYGNPFPRDPAVLRELERAGMIRPVAPLPWRRAELRRLARMFGLPE